MNVRGHPLPLCRLLRGRGYENMIPERTDKHASRFTTAVPNGGVKCRK